MTRSETIRPEFVEFIPGTLQSGVLYISRKYKTASHLCCCGCGNKVVTPLNPSGWQLTQKRGLVSLYPSIGNWNLSCQSHYWIRSNRIQWAEKWSREEIDAGRKSDFLARRQLFDAPRRREGVWRRLVNFIGSLKRRWRS